MYIVHKCILNIRIRSSKQLKKRNYGHELLPLTKLILMHQLKLMKLKGNI